MLKLKYLILLFLPISIFATTPAAITFDALNYDQALEAGKAQNKMIFINYNSMEVDPCQIMEETTFSNDAVIALMNANFININADIDEILGKEWITKFGIECLPTLMVLDNDGKLEGINQGTLTTPTFLKWLTAIPNVKLKIEETKLRKERALVKADNLLAIKRKLKAAEGNYVRTKIPTSITVEDKSIESETILETVENVSEETEIEELVFEEAEEVEEVTFEEVEEIEAEEIVVDEEKTFIPEKVKIPYGENLKNTSITRTMSYSIQIGAYANYVNAKNIMEKCKEDFDDHYYILEEPNKNGKYLYKVIIGTYTSQENAQQALGKLISQGYNGFLRRI